ncbi:MAG: hypothetical protein HY556_04240 [Euryarchaeota archaeon]|nr:hypothetical protein [Euryarchaeota archaeon]
MSRRKGALAFLALAILLTSIVPLARAQDVPDPNEVRTYEPWPVITKSLQDIAAAHPDIVKMHSIGLSSKGMDLWLMEFADFTNPKMRPLEEREVVWVDGGIHAGEYSGEIIGKRFVEWLAEGYPSDADAKWIIENRHTFIMPLANPDGSMGTQRLNGNLVNLNRNFPVGWAGIDEDPLFNNPGPSAMSESETKAMVAKWLELQPDYYGSIHCCGNLLLYPYGIEGRDPPDKEIYERICNEVYTEWERKRCGPIWSTIYPASGSTVDTAYDWTGAVSWGFELQDSYGYATEDPAHIDRVLWQGIVHAMKNVHLYAGYPELSLLSISTDQVIFRVENKGWGNATNVTVTIPDSTGVNQTAYIPFISPGDASSARVQGNFAPGSYDLELRWMKRVQMERHRTVTIPFTVETVGDVVTAKLGEDVEAPIVKQDLLGPARTPGPSVETVLFATIALALVLRRPRAR